MGGTYKQRIFVGDFETTVYKGQTHTEVWASAVVELGTEDVVIMHSIDETFEFLKNLNQNVIIYYHNLKFDGSFWLSYLLLDKGFSQACTYLNEEKTKLEWKKNKEMYNNTFKYSISAMGQFYTITIKVNNHIIEIRDSLKLLPFSVKKIGDSFGTKHKKLDMKYEGFRYAGCEITQKEKEYIANDVLVVKEALEIMYADGHNKLTIGACCLEEFKRSEIFAMGKEDYEMFFPSLIDIELDKDIYGSSNVDAYIRKSYKGGWCYLVKGKEKKLYYNGTTADVNSLYPSQMHSISGRKYPVGLPTFWKGNFIPPEAEQENKYFFIRIKTRFYLKENMLPFIQIKGTLHYKGTEALETSDIFDPTDGKYYANYIDSHGNTVDTRVTLTLTMVDYKLFLEHYEAVDFEILDGCYFQSIQGIFDEYIDKYALIKKNNKGAKREEAKLFLNNLYGKLASNDDSSFKFAYIKDDKSIGFTLIAEHKKKTGYIPCGSAITSHARDFTIRSAQKNYYGKDKRGFIYADTDSIHCDLQPEEIKGIKVHDKDFCCWKLEAQWDIAIFTRQKTYIEHVTHEDTIPVENLVPPKEPYFNIKCAGMPDKCKNLFNLSMQGHDNESIQEYQKKKDIEFNDEELEFVLKKRSLLDFKEGLKVPSKLLPKRIHGGILLTPTTYEMR